MKRLLEPAGFGIVDILDFRGRPGEKKLERAAELGRKIAERVKEHLVVPSLKSEQ